jgi:outer membrane lipoprotein-sorting protein
MFNSMLKMDFSYALIVLGLMSHHAAPAQPSGFTKIENIAAFKLKFSDEGKKITSVQSVFVQEKTLSVLEEKITSEGKFWYQRERKVRIEYLRPFLYLMILNGDKILIRDGQKETRVSTHSNKLFRQINNIMVDCVSGNILDNKDFSSSLFQNNESYLLVMTPVAKSMKDFFQTIRVVVDKKDWSVVTITLEEPGGDNTIFRFREKVLNQKLDDALFLP